MYTLNREEESFKVPAMNVASYNKILSRMCLMLDISIKKFPGNSAV